MLLENQFSLAVASVSLLPEVKQVPVSEWCCCTRTYVECGCLGSCPALVQYCPPNAWKGGGKAAVISRLARAAFCSVARHKCPANGSPPESGVVATDSGPLVLLSSRTCTQSGSCQMDEGASATPGPQQPGRSHAGQRGGLGRGRGGSWGRDGRGGRGRFSGRGCPQPHGRAAADPNDRVRMVGAWVQWVALLGTPTTLQ